MKIAIVYATTHGTTEKVAKLLKERLKFEVELIDLKANNEPDVSQYDMIIVGTSIHMGVPHKEVKRFLKQYMDILLEKKLALFTCCMLKEQELSEFDAAYPVELRAHSIRNEILGGEYLISKMNFMERMAVKMIGKTTSDVSKIDMAKIDFFAELISDNIKK